MIAVRGSMSLSMAIRAESHAVPDSIALFGAKNMMHVEEPRIGSPSSAAFTFAFAAAPLDHSVAYSRISLYAGRYPFNTLRAVASNGCVVQSWQIIDRVVR